jgi:hypothetical protein
MRSLAIEPTLTASLPVSTHVQSRRRELLVRIGLTCWAALVFAISASLAAAHWSTLPHPERQNPQLTRGVAALRNPAGDGWLAVHALYSHCRCSQRIVAHLLARAAVSGVQEHLLWVGPDAERKAELHKAGFVVHSTSALALKRDFGVVAVPLLIVADARDRVHYVGGYTTHAQGADIRDQAILENLLHERAQSALPIFGCAVSRSLQKILDPFGLKY